MARQKTIDQLITELEPSFRNAFLEAVSEIVDKVSFVEIKSALEDNDVDRVLRVISLDRAIFDRFETILLSAYGDGGKAAVSLLPPLAHPEGGKFVIRFNPRDIVAKQWFDQHSSRLITSILEEQRTNIRRKIEFGVNRGDNPVKIARDLIGKRHRGVKGRKGGIIGLSEQQEKFLRNAQEELETGDYASYRQRKLRNKNFDATIRKAIKDGKKLTKAQIDRAMAGYSAKLLGHRAIGIARTEALAVLNRGQYEALLQMVATGVVKPENVRRVWDATGDARTRLSHSVADGQEVGLFEDFVMPSGATLRHPGDPKGGAAEVINCRCSVKVKIDHLAGVT